MELSEVIKGILATRKEISGAWDYPVKLSDLGNKLSMGNAYLGDHLGDYMHDRELKYGNRVVELIMGEMSPSAAEIQARAESANLQAQVKKLTVTHKDAESMVVKIQSHLKTLENKERGNV